MPNSWNIELAVQIAANLMTEDEKSLPIADLEMAYLAKVMAVERVIQARFDTWHAEDVDVVAKMLEISRQK